MGRTKWTKEIIVKQLQQWHAAGVPVKSLWRQDQRLSSSAAIIFGSWRKALEAAGLEPVRQRWSRELVIEELRKSGANPRAISSKLRAAAVREFGSIVQGYIAAGLKSQRRPPSLPLRNWNVAQTVTAIRERRDSGKSLSATATEDPTLYSAAKRFHGSWAAALRASGVKPTEIKCLSATEVIRRIQERQRNGAPLTHMHQHDPQLVRAASYHFGNWSKALLAAGVVKTIPGRWSQRIVIEGIRARHQRGESLAKTWREDKHLFSAGLRYFGSWGDAMRAAGFEPIHRERWSKDRVIERLQAFAARNDIGKLRQIDNNLSAAAFRFFGSRKAALKAAGIEPRGRLWTEAKVLAKMQDSYIAGAPLHAVGKVDRSLAVAAKRRFGSWPAAVEAAGLSNKVTLKAPVRRWSRESVLEEILAWHQSGRSLTEVHRSNQALSSAAKKWLGSWRAALQAVGLEAKQRAWSKQAVIDDILNHLRNGRSLNSGLRSNINLASAARRYFGSYRKAIAKAEIQLRRAKRMGA